MPYELTETLFEPVEKDGTTVKDGDPRARFLVGVAGQSIPDDEAERLGLTSRKSKAAAADEADTAPAGKAVQADDVANKSIQMGGDAKGKGR